MELLHGDCLEVACVNTNRDFIGIELDDRYFRIAKDRIEAAQKEVQNVIA